MSTRSPPRWISGRSSPARGAVRGGRRARRDAGPGSGRHRCGSRARQARSRVVSSSTTSAAIRIRLYLRMSRSAAARSSSPGSCGLRTTPGGVRRRERRVPLRTVGLRTVAVVDDGDPPAGPLERAGLGDGDDAEAAASEPALPRSERVRRRHVLKLGELGERDLGDGGKAGGKTPHERARRSAGQVDWIMSGSGVLREQPAPRASSPT